MKATIEALWEKRSKDYGTQIRGVLPKSFPPTVNNYLHQWMYEQIKLKVKSDTQSLALRAKLKILDLGCGYGRLSQEVLQNFPKVKTVGIDVSSTYVSLYNKNLNPRGKAVVGDIRRLPFREREFDLVFMVTTLMYITSKDDQKLVVKEIFRVLKKGGKFVFIERNPTGAKIITLGGLVTKLRGEKHQEIPSVSFSPDYMCNLIKVSGGVVNKLTGIPVFTLLLLFLIVVSLINNMSAKKLIKLVGWLDQQLNSLLTPSLYISYSGKRD